MSDMKPLIFNIVYLLALPAIMGCSGHNGSLPSDQADQEEITQDSAAQSVITFSKLTHDFGTILEGVKVVCYFDYENTGNADLMIHSVDATCGCTTPDWSSEPVKTGDRKSLKIIFDATGRSGAQRKVVTVMSNASNEVVKLTIKANIET
jgi:hypothetical protein